uniref:Putative treble-clef zinc-finger domain-containing protein n=1 Tax=Gasterosteus aculeatus aculeatus TaxID=481459 RepID=A0AAQ4NT78_GASAC
MEPEVTASSPSGALSSSAPQTSPAPAHLAAKQRDGRKTPSAAPAFLSNLGRATLRGIRKCPQCGVYNGTRGLSCKNKACGISLRNASSAAGRSGKKCAVDAVRVIVDSEERRGKEGAGVGRGGDGAGGPGGASAGGVQVFSVRHRGRGSTATQLGFVELVPTDTAIATGDGATLLTRINLGRCFLPSCRQGQRSHRGEAESGTAASKQPPDSLCVHIKQAIECSAFSTPLTLKSSVLDGLQASIQARKELWRLATESPGPLVQRVAKGTLVVKCHVDSQHPLGLLHLTVGAGGLSEGVKSERKGREQQHAVFHCACQVGGRRSKAGVDAAGGSADLHPPPSGPDPSQPCLHFYACVCALASDEKLASEFAAFIKYTPNGVQQNAPGPGGKPRPADPISPLLKTKKLRLDESLSGGMQVVDERALTLGFQQWLAGVTERIHQTMHYQFDGKPEPLVYHIPQEFFSALLHRLSLASKKKRLPNFTSAVVRNDGLPLGSFCKHTWHITSLTQVKRVFDTSEVPLELTQSFVKNADGSYSRFRCPEPPPDPEPPEGPRTDRPQAIRPMELRTFLRVGPAAEQTEAGPFVIEWIPDVLPRCRMGELRIAFEFGHQQGGSDPTKHASAVEILQKRDV